MKLSIMFVLMTLGLTGCGDASNEFSKHQFADGFEVCINEKKFYLKEFDDNGKLLDLGFSMNTPELGMVSGRLMSPNRKKGFSEKVNLKKELLRLNSTEYQKKFKVNPEAPLFFALEKDEYNLRVEFYQNRPKGKDIDENWLSQNLIASCISDHKICSTYFLIDDSRVSLTLKYKDLARYYLVEKSIKQSYIAPVSRCHNY